MTTDTTSGTVQQSFPAPPPPPARRGGAIAAVVIGVLVATSGLLTALSGAVLLAVFGGGHAIASGDRVVSTPTSAIVADLGHIDDIRGFEPITGSPTLQVSAHSVDGGAVFVGVGRAEDVQRYLSGVATDRVTDLELAPFRLDTVRHEGSAVAEPPVAQSFWVASAQSTTDAELSWPIREGDYQIVVMNADGTAKVLTTASVGAGLPTSSALWIVVIGIGVLLTVGGTALIVVGARRSANR